MRQPIEFPGLDEQASGRNLALVSGDDGVAGVDLGQYSAVDNVEGGGELAPDRDNPVGTKRLSGQVPGGICIWSVMESGTNSSSAGVALRTSIVVKPRSSGW